MLPQHYRIRKITFFFFLTAVDWLRGVFNKIDLILKDDLISVSKDDVSEKLEFNSFQISFLYRNIRKQITLTVIVN